MKTWRWVLLVGLLSGCDRVWTVSGEVTTSGLATSIPSCKEVRGARDEVYSLLEEIHDRTDQLMAIAEEDSNSNTRAQLAKRLAAEISALRLRIKAIYPSSLEVIDRVLEYRWNVPLKGFLDPLPSPKADPRRLKIRSIEVASVKPRVGTWPAEIPFETLTDPEQQTLTVIARRRASPLEACLDDERVYLEIVVNAETNLYGMQTLSLRLKGERPRK